MKHFLTVSFWIIFNLSQAFAASDIMCVGSVPFTTWLEGVKTEALQRGVSAAVLQAALPKMIFDQTIIDRDHAQGVFQQSFLKFSDRMVNEGRVNAGRKVYSNEKYKELMTKIEQEYGVSPFMIMAFWGLETDFGASVANLKFSILAAVTTLACDPRRADMFREHLIHALLLIERGDRTVDTMIGNWAGEYGGLQFMSKDYYLFGVDYDNDKKIDIVNSVPDTMATGANFLAKKGWHRGEPWQQEVKIANPEKMKWQEAGIDITHSVKEWKDMGVIATDGNLANENLQASLLLPMGHKGPAFLAYPNFKVLLEWNSSITYITTAGYFGTRLSGAKLIDHSAQNLPLLSQDQMIELQKILIARGHDVGDADGKLGLKTRQAIREEQLKLGLPADAFPDAELLQKLKK